MGKLTNLLKWKKPISIKDEKGLSLKDDEGNPVIVYMRVIGDKDLEDASFRARVASSIKRLALFNPESEDHLTTVKIFDEADREQCIEMIRQGQGANWAGEAFSAVVVPDLPTIEEVAVDPDAPTLEEMERLDKLVAQTNEDYKKSVANYIQTKEKVLLAELKDKTDEELRAMAKENIIIIASIETYLAVMRDEKTWRSVYQDENYTLKEFNSIEEFQNLNITLKDQLREEYEKLEAGLDDIKN